MQRQPPHPPRTAKSCSQNQAGQAKISAKPKYDSSPARPIHRSRQGCRRIPATHSPHPLRQENQVPPPHPLLPICVLMETSRQGKSPQAGMHTEQGRKITSPPQHAAMTNAWHCEAQCTALHEPMHRTTFFFHRSLSPRAALFTLHFSLFTSRRDHFSLFTLHSSLPAGTTLHSSLCTLHFPQGCFSLPAGTKQGRHICGAAPAGYL